MKFRNFIQKNVLELLYTVGFCAFLGFLIYIAVVGQRIPIFYDALSQVDVSHAYTSELHVFRIIFEPLIGTFLIIGLEFMYWIVLLPILYFIIRTIALILDKIRFDHKIKTNGITLIFQDALRFTFLWGFMIFFLGVIAFGIGYAFGGAVFLSSNFRWILEVISWTNLGLFFGKLGFNIVMYCRKRNINHLKFHQIRTKLLSKIKIMKLKIFMISSKREIIRFLSLFWLVLMLTQGLQYIHFPTQTINTILAPDEFLFDFHCHTTHSDGTLSPAQRVDWYIRQGIQGAAFSDHHNLKGAIQAQEYVERKNLDFIVIKAQEFTDDPENIHLNIYGETDTVVIPDNYWGELNSTETLSCSEAIQWAKSAGLYVTVNHYEDPGSAPFTYEQLRDWGVDGFEIVNGAREQAAEIRQFCLNNNLICMGGSDVHTNEDLDTFVKLQLEDPDNKTIDSIFTALYQNTHEVVAVKYRSKKNYGSVDFINDILNYFHGLSFFQSLSWIGWSLVSYVVCILWIKSMKLGSKAQKDVSGR